MGYKTIRTSLSLDDKILFYQYSVYHNKKFIGAITRSAKEKYYQKNFCSLKDAIDSIKKNPETP